MSHWLFDEPALESELAPAMEADIGKAMEIAKAGAEQLAAIDTQIASLMNDRSDIVPAEMTLYQTAIKTVESIQAELLPCAKLNPSIWRTLPVIGTILGAVIGSVVGTQFKDMTKKLNTIIDGDVLDPGVGIGLFGGATGGAYIGLLVKRRMNKVGVTRDTKLTATDRAPHLTADYLKKIDKPFDQFNDHEARALITAIYDDLAIKKKLYTEMDESFGKAARNKFTTNPGDRTLRFRFD